MEIDTEENPAPEPIINKENNNPNTNTNNNKNPQSFDNSKFPRVKLDSNISLFF